MSYSALLSLLGYRRLLWPICTRLEQHHACKSRILVLPCPIRELTRISTDSRCEISHADPARAGFMHPFGAFAQLGSAKSKKFLLLLRCTSWISASPINWRLDSATRLRMRVCTGGTDLTGSSYPKPLQAPLRRGFLFWKVSALGRKQTFPSGSAFSLTGTRPFGSNPH